MSDIHFIALVIVALFIGKILSGLVKGIYLYLTSEAQDGDQ